MSIDNKVNRQYDHITSEYVLNFPSINENTSLTPPIRSHFFYEGMLNFEGKKAIFVLHKETPDIKTFLEVGTIFKEMNTARIFQSQLGHRLVPEHIKSDHRKKISETYSRFNIASDRRLDKPDILAGVLYAQFSEEASVIVPGFIGDYFVDGDGNFNSTVEPIPHRKKDLFRSTLRLNGFKGQVKFW